MIVVSNSGPLISLAKINNFVLLRQIFKKILIPEWVYVEVVEEGKGRFGEKETKDALGHWIEKVAVGDRLAVQLLLPEIKRGEAESIVLAKERNADVVLLDDKDARDIAEASGLTIKGTIGVLFMAKEMGMIKNLKTVIDTLSDKGFYIDDDTYRRILKRF